MASSVLCPQSVKNSNKGERSAWRSKGVSRDQPSGRPWETDVTLAQRKGRGDATHLEDEAVLARHHQVRQILGNKSLPRLRRQQTTNKSKGGGGVSPVGFMHRAAQRAEGKVGGGGEDSKNLKINMRPQRSEQKCKRRSNNSNAFIEIERGPLCVRDHQYRRIREQARAGTASRGAAPTRLRPRPRTAPATSFGLIACSARLPGCKQVRHLEQK